MKRERKTKPAPWTQVKRWAKDAGVEKKPKSALRPAPRKARVKPRSKAMESRMAVYRRKAEAYKIANPVCIRAGCSRKTSDVHHSRGRAGRLLLEEQHWRPVCRSCHDWIAANPVGARADGLLCEKGKWGAI